MFVCRMWGGGRHTREAAPAASWGPGFFPGAAGGQRPGVRWRRATVVRRGTLPCAAPGIVMAQQSALILVYVLLTLRRWTRGEDPRQRAAKRDGMPVGRRETDWSTGCSDRAEPRRLGRYGPPQHQATAPHNQKRFHRCHRSCSFYSVLGIPGRMPCWLIPLPNGIPSLSRVWTACPSFLLAAERLMPRPPDMALA
jgi:hypothetical protein